MRLHDWCLTPGGKNEDNETYRNWLQRQKNRECGEKRKNASPRLAFLYLELTSVGIGTESIRWGYVSQ
jgi:hypothetical protein